MGGAHALFWGDVSGPPPPTWSERRATEAAEADAERMLLEGQFGSEPTAKVLAELAAALSLK